MKKWYFAAAMIIWITLPCLAAQTLSTSDIDKVREKAVLNSDDLGTIDVFVEEAIDQIVNTTEFTDISRLRNDFVSRKESNKPEQNQYRDQFIDSAARHFAKGFSSAAAIEDEKQRLLVTMNLMICVDNLADLRLLGLVYDKLGAKEEPIRHLAVRTITNAKLKPQLTSNPDAAKQITAKLEKFTASNSIELLRMVCQFAADVNNIPETEQLLIKIADNRIAKYADWTVENEEIDSFLIKSMCKRARTSTKKDAIIARFAQILSYSIQRYVKGQETLDDYQKSTLAANISEAEKYCIGIHLEMYQLTLRNALQQNDLKALMAEHDRLLGTEKTKAAIMEKASFEYIRADGSKSSFPAKLAEPTD
jgi:hypothetical protein